MHHHGVLCSQTAEVNVKLAQIRRTGRGAITSRVPTRDRHISAVTRGEGGGEQLSHGRVWLHRCSAVLWTLLLLLCPCPEVRCRSGGCSSKWSSGCTGLRRCLQRTAVASGAIATTGRGRVFVFKRTRPAMCPVWQKLEACRTNRPLASVYSRLAHVQSARVFVDPRGHITGLA